MRKTHIDSLRNPNYLGGWDFLDENGKTSTKVVTITDIKNESVFNQKTQGEEQVLTVFFNECLPIILNATNRKMLKKVTATDFVEDMIGKQITLTTKKVKAFGEMHDAIRIIPNTATVQVNDTKAIATLNEATTLVELQSKWSSLSLQDQEMATVTKCKDDLKSKLS